MKYEPIDPNDVLSVITHGSHLYGTNTSTSDHDFKVVTLPPLRDMLLGKDLKVRRYRFDSEGKPVSPSAPMDDNGWEAEHTPVQKFCIDWLRGQAYAVETVFAVLQNPFEHYPQEAYTTSRWELFYSLCKELSTKFLHKSLDGMVGFALKQTLDYVHRSERLKKAEGLLLVLESATRQYGSSIRLDTPVFSSVGTEFLDTIASLTGLHIGESKNRDRTHRTLLLNGRAYLDTTPIRDLTESVQKMVDSYGARTNQTSEDPASIDWKSLMHAVRVYEQVLELLDIGAITFPRPNAQALLAIRRQEREPESVRTQLRQLEAQVTERLASSTPQNRINGCVH